MGSVTVLFHRAGEWFYSLPPGLSHLHQEYGASESPPLMEKTDCQVRIEDLALTS